MSRSNPAEDVRTVNPASRFYEWVGSVGNLSYYDKQAKVKVEVSLPFTFLPIARCVTLKGYNDDSQTSYWANEVKDISKDVFTVHGIHNPTKRDTIVAVGLYKDIKPKLDALKIDYTESLYIGVKNATKTLDLCNFQIKGSAIGSWIEFSKAHKVMEIAVQVSGSTPKKKGVVNYQEPIYIAITKISKEMNDQAIALDMILQEYLTGYLAKNAASTAEVGAEKDLKAADPLPSLREQKEITAATTQASEPELTKDFGDTDDIPF